MTEETKTAESAKSAGNTTEKGKECRGRVFTEKQVESIIGERLSRERRGNSALSKIRDMIMKLAEKGVLKSRSIPEMGEELEALLSGIAGGAENIEDNEQITEAPADKTAAAGEDASKSSENAPDRKAEIIDFMKVFPGVSLEELLSDEDFCAFIEGKNGTLCQMYAEYIRNMGLKLEEEAAKRRSRLISGLSSTGFSAKSSGAEDYSSLLTPNQMQIAKNAGMSYREYADYLAQISSKGNLI